MEILRHFLTSLVPIFWFGCFFVFPFLGPYALVAGAKRIWQRKSFHELACGVIAVALGITMLAGSAALFTSVLGSGGK